MLKKCNLKTIIFALTIILASVYLVFIVDTRTLNTLVKRIFIFCYFILASFLVLKCCLKFKLFKHKLASLIALIGAAVSLIFAQGVFLPGKNDHVFYVQSIQNPENDSSECGDVIISGITVDGKKQKLSKIDAETSGAWSYDKALDLFKFTGVSNDNLISIPVVGESVTFSFKSENPASYVRIYDDNGYEKILSLAEKDPETGISEITIPYAKTYSIAERIIYNIGAAIAVTFAYNALIELLLRVIKKDSKKKV